MAAAVDGAPIDLIFRRRAPIESGRCRNGKRAEALWAESRLAAETSMIDEPSHCRECGCPARSIAAKECRASDCPLNSANRQEPAHNPYGRSLDQPLAAQWHGAEPSPPDHASVT